MIKDKHAGGRPTEYTEAIAEAICDRLANGEGLVSICRDEEMPARSTVHSWLNEKSDVFKQEFLDKYMRARDDQADYKAEEIEEIADKVIKGEVKPDAARVAIDAKKWTASKLKPRRYGERIEQEITHHGDVTFINDMPRPKE